MTRVMLCRKIFTENLAIFLILIHFFVGWVRDRSFFTGIGGGGACGIGGGGTKTYIDIEGGASPKIQRTKGGGQL